MAQTKERNMAAELPIDEVAHGNMPAKGTKVAKLVAMAKGFLPECKVQDFPPEPEMACMKISCFLSCWFAEKVSKPEARLIFGEAYPYLKCGEKNTIINKLTEYRAWLKKKKSNIKNGGKTNLAVMQVLRAMDGHGVQAGSASKPGKRPRKKLISLSKAQLRRSLPNPASLRRLLQRRNHSQRFSWQRLWTAAKAWLKMKLLPRSACKKFLPVLLLGLWVHVSWGSLAKP